MKIRVSEDTTEQQARAIAEALASQYLDDVTVTTEGGDELTTATYDGPGHIPGPDPAMGPTDRE